jgi:hypothetical protein
MIAESVTLTSIYAIQHLRYTEQDTEEPICVSYFFT